jgi:hypothetical protein
VPIIRAKKRLVAAITCDARSWGSEFQPFVMVRMDCCTFGEAACAQVIIGANRAFVPFMWHKRSLIATIACNARLVLMEIEIHNIRPTAGFHDSP